MSSSDSEVSPEERFRLLDERIQQLETDNARLRSNSDQGNTTGLRASDAPVNSGLNEGGGASGSGTTSTTNRAERYIFLPRERKCPRFSGKSTDVLPVEEWVEEARRSLGVRHMSRAEQALFLYDLLDGEAKNEIKFRPYAERNDPDKILAVLIDIFGCSKSFISLQKQFFQRKQLEGESIREFSHALLALMEAIKRNNSRGIPDPDALVRDQFIEHVRDGLLRRELKKSVRLNPDASFLAMRSEAIRWVEDGERVGTPRPRSYSCDSQALLVSECRADSHAVTVKPNDELAEMKECLRKQQTQLDTILQHLSSSHSPTIQGQGFGGPSHRPYRFQPDGKPICLRCGQPNHIARFCRTELSNSSGQTVRGRVSVQGAEAGEAAAVSGPQGN